MRFQKIQIDNTISKKNKLEDPHLLISKHTINLQVSCFHGGSAVKNLLAMQEMQFQSLSGEDPLEEGMATHSSILARTTLWTEETGGLQSIGSQRVRHDWSDWAHKHSVSFSTQD